MTRSVGPLSARLRNGYEHLMLRSSTPPVHRAARDLLLTSMQAQGKYDYIMWLDADAAIVDQVGF